VPKKTHEMNKCHVCASTAVATLLDFGNQALSNRFLNNPQKPEDLFPLALGQCEGCGLIQISNPTSPDELRPRFDWITYNEQEGHLDHLVETICALPGIGKDAHIGAISFKDDSTLSRLEKKGFKSAWRLNPLEDLGIKDPCAGLETVQACLSMDGGKAIAKKRGLVDVLIVRHILEHAHEPRRFASQLTEMVKQGGYLVFEVPDCSPALARGDYTMPWEDHILYFTPATFRSSVARLGFSPVHVACYPYSNENSLVAIVQPGSPNQAPDADTGPKDSTARIYAEGFQKYRSQIAQELKDRKQKGKIAIFGAGHLSCAWVNLLQTQDYIEFFADDHPKKRGLYMPGSHLPIRGSASLLEENIKLCLLSLSPESELKVVAKNQQFLALGGAFASIFPGKPNSL
jgi:Putative zinc binding domain/C-methyltransferase C-terminal domain/Methyltransferase domain